MRKNGCRRRPDFLDGNSARRPDREPQPVDPLAGPLAAGRWTSLQNGIGNLAGIAASWFTGAVVERTGSFPLAFVAASLFALAGAFLWVGVVGPVQQVRWSESV